MVTTGKPKSVSGSIYRAPLSTTAPSDATTALAAGFVSLGYVSEDGVTISPRKISSYEKKAWGGAVVLSGIETVAYNAKFTLIDEAEMNVLKTIYGENNVTGTNISNGITVTVKPDDFEYYSWVIETLLDNGKKAKRIYIPKAKVTEVGDVVYKDNEAIGYEVTLSGVVDANDVFAKEFIKQIST